MSLLLKKEGINILSLLMTGYRLLRIKHWTKQSFIFFGFIFSGLWQVYFFQAIIAACSFSLAASSVYIYNDIEDIELDKKHPVKRHRPIPSGRVKIIHAYLFIFLLNVLSFALCAFLSVKAALLISLYLFINVMYSNGLKHYPLIDVLCIGSGFMLRILMGTWAIGIAPSHWILWCGTALSLFLALSKRKLEWDKLPLSPNHSRPVLQRYNKTLINLSLVISGLFFLSSYLIYVYRMSYNVHPSTHLIMTVPFVLFGFARYVFLISKMPKTDCLVNLLMNDKISLVNSMSLLCLLFWLFRII